MRVKIAICGVLALLASSTIVSATDVDPAQAIAQKFSEASDPKPAKVAAPERPSLDYEMEMLRAARAEEAARKAEDAKQATAVAAPKPVPPPAAVVPPAIQPADSAKSVSAIAEQSKTVPAGPTPAALPKPALQSATPPVSPSVTKVAETAAKPQPEAAAARVTVLLVLDSDTPSGATKSVPDPIICLTDTCYISGGLEAPARQMPRNDALALKSTSAASADSCSGKMGCVFRNVPLSPDTQIHVIELGSGPSTADAAFTVSADASCKKDDGDLVCANALVTHAFRVWVVPEETAQSVGAGLLEDAVAEGLPPSDTQPVADK